MQLCWRFLIFKSAQIIVMIEKSIKIKGKDNEAHYKNFACN